VGRGPEFFKTLPAKDQGDFLILVPALQTPSRRRKPVQVPHRGRGNLPAVEKDAGKMHKTMIIKALLVVGISMLAGAALAQTTTSTTAGWYAPTTGTPVEHYVVQHSVNEGSWQTVGTTTDTEFVLELTNGDSHRVRVAGVDADGRQGPFSLPSNSYNPEDPDPGPPGQPGQPILF
jgi:hypothetical protein